MKKTSFQEGLEKAWQEYLKAERAKKYPNIMLLGVSGGGKSSLVNCVFGIEIAKTSNVAPETKGYCDFFDGHKYGRKVNLIDTAGYELNQSEHYLSNISKAINSKYDGAPIHILWCCISLGDERIEEIDLHVLHSLKKIQSFQGRLCIVFTHCDLDDADRSKKNAFIKVLQNAGLNDLPLFDVSNNPKLKLQLTDLIKWSTEQLKDEDFRQSFIGSQMGDLELKKKEADRIINNACLSIGALKVSEMLLHDDKKKALAEHQMKMITEIFSVYGIDCLAGLTKKFEKVTSLVDFGNGLVSFIVKVIPKAEKFQEYIKTAAATGLTKAVGSAASKISYSYVEKHIKGIPVKLEEFYSNPDSAGIIATLLDNVISVSGSKLLGQKDDKNMETMSKANTKGKKKNK